MNSQTGRDIESPSLSKKVDRRRCLHFRFFNLPLLLVIIVAVTADGALIEWPQNAAVIAGQEVTLTCKTDEPDTTLRWSITDKNSQPVVIFNGDNVVPAFRGEYKVNQGESGQFDLQFNASAKTAKRFDCRESGKVTTQSAEVIVLESSPICERNSDSSRGNLSFACKVNAYGNWIPKVVLQMVKTTQSESLGSAHSNVYMLKSVTYHTVTCQTAFDRQTYKGDVNAANVPDPHNSAPCQPPDPPTTTLTTMTTLPYSTTPPPDKPCHKALYVCVGILAGVSSSATVVVLWFKRKKLPCWPTGEKKSTATSLPLNTTPKDAEDV